MSDAASKLRITQAQDLQQTNYPITVIVIPGQQLSLHLFKDDRYDGVSIERMLGHFATLLENSVGNSQIRLCELRDIDASRIASLWWSGMQQSKIFESFEYPRAIESASRANTRRHGRHMGQ